MVTIYMPDGSAGIEYVPLSDVVAAFVSPVALFFAVTLALGTTAPRGSSTVPAMDPVGFTCPKAGKLNKVSATEKRKNFESKFLIGLLREWLICLDQGVAKAEVAICLSFLKCQVWTWPDCFSEN